MRLLISLPRWVCLVLLLTCVEILSACLKGSTISNCDGSERRAATCVFPALTGLPIIRISSLRFLWTSLPTGGIGAGVCGVGLLLTVVLLFVVVFGLLLSDGGCRTLEVRRKVVCLRFILMKVVRTFGTICVM